MTPRRRAGLALLAIVLVATGVSSLVRLSRGGAWPEQNVAHSDFDGFWRAGRDVLAGRDIYARSPVHGESAVARYLPSFPVAMVPLALLPLPLAGALWHLLSVGALVASARAVLRLARPRLDPVSRQGALVLVVTAPAWVDALVLGQITLVVLWITLASVEALSRGRDLRAGALLALALALKVTPGLLLVYALVKRRFVVALATCVSFVAICASTAAVFGPSRAVGLHRQWGREQAVLAGGAFLEQSRSLRYANASLHATLARTLTDTNAGTDDRPFKVNVASLPGPSVARLLLAVQVSASLAFGFLGVRSGRFELAEVGVLLGLTPLFSPIAWTSHFVFTMPAAASLAVAGDAASRRFLYAGLLLQLSLAHPVARAFGGLLLADLVLTAGAARLAWRRALRSRPAPPRARRA